MEFSFLQKHLQIRMPPCVVFLWKSTNRFQQSENKKSRSSYLFRIETGSIELSSYVRFHSSKIPLRALRESNVAIWSCMWVQKPGCLEEEDLLIFFNGDYYNPKLYCISKQIQTKRYNFFLKDSRNEPIRKITALV